MKKTLLIISILSIVLFLTGCGVFNLNGWIWPEDDLEFAKLISELNTPELIGNYMHKNFKYEAHKIYAPDPYTLWKTGKGDCNDFSTFGQFMAYRNGIEAYTILISFKGTFYNHMIAVYVEDYGKSFTDNRRYLNNNGFYFNSFREIVDYDTENYIGLRWTKYIVYDYNMEKIEEGE